MENKKKVSINCESCEFYDLDENDEYTCRQNLDQDEMRRFILQDNGRCPYYRYHDEYKTTQKQI